MSRRFQTERIATLAVAVCVALGFAAQPSAADEEKRRVVKKIRIECEGDECAEHEEMEGAHAFVMSTGDKAHQLKFRTRIGGAFLGVQLAELTPELRTHFGVADDAGVMVSRVVDDSPAHRAGIRVGDIITALDGKSLGSGSQLAHAIRGHEEGESVLLEIWRDGSVQQLTATLEERSKGPLGMDYAFVVKCDDDEVDCSFARKHLGGAGDWEVDFDCGEGEGPCDLQVSCDEAGDCECTMNGEAAECSELPGFDE